MAGGLAAAELLAGLWDTFRSPVTVVGDRVVDLVPPAVKDWAISTFGTSDKAVLMAGTLVLLAVAAAVVGVLAVRRSVRAALVGVGVFALIGVVASLGRGGRGGVLPAVVAGVVAAAVLVVLAGRARRAASPIADPAAVADDRVVSMRAAQAGSRRGFLGLAAAVGAGAVAAGAAGRWLQQQGAVAVERLKVVLPRPAVPAPAVPAGVELGVEGVTPFITPNEDFYRIDTALVVPRVSTDGWTLRVGGYVDRPITLTYEQLLARPMQETVATIACVSNEVGGDLVGTAKWLGCRLDDLLAEAGVQARADQVVGVSVDGFTAGFPMALLDGRDALVVVGMNGEPLPERHGYPARLVVPGVYGYVSATKWLNEIRLTRFDEFEGYWIPRGWSREGPVLTQSRIDTPRPGATVTAGRPVAIAGVAWAPTRAVAGVEVRIDEGAWRPARLGEEYAATTWRQWVLDDWVPTPGSHTLEVRATDGTGTTQTEQVTDVAPDGARGWHTVRVTAR
ncbi:MAG: molybdopterin-dependent oxidoreductase [Microthrixaceae bacterium]